jgi:multidrug resistance protein, MATE family
VRSSQLRRLFELSVPVVGLNFLAVLTLAVDTAMCGRLPDADVALTALGFAIHIVFLLMVVMMGVTVGTVALVSRAFGAGDAGRVNHLLAQSTQLAILVGVAVAIAGNLLAEPGLRGLGATDAATETGLHYLRVLLAGTPLYYLLILHSAALRGVGNTRLPFLVALVQNALNVVFNYALILGNLGLPALGVRGAAIGTVASQAVGVLIMVHLLARGRVSGLRLGLHVAPIDRPLARELVRVGAPAALDMLVLNVTFLVVLGILGRIDEIAVAAHGVGLRVQALAFVPGLGVSQATAALVGQALGAARVDEARAVLRASLFLCVAIMTTLGAAFVVAADAIIAVFSVAPGTDLAAHSRTWIRILGAGMPAFGIHVALIGVLQGAGATNTSLRINVIGTLVQLAAAALMTYGLGWGPAGVWLSFPLSTVVRDVLAAAAIRRGAWAQVGVRPRGSR